MASGLSSHASQGLGEDEVAAKEAALDEAERIQVISRVIGWVLDTFDRRRDLDPFLGTHGPKGANRRRCCVFAHRHRFTTCYFVKSSGRLPLRTLRCEGFL